MNKAAADWVCCDATGNLTEPWLFLIGADGVIIDRWGPLFDPDAVAGELAELPRMSPESGRRADYHQPVPMSPDMRTGRRPRPAHEHRHEHFATADAAVLATDQGVRATWISLAVLAATAVVQLSSCSSPARSHCSPTRSTTSPTRSRPSRC